MTIVDIVNTFLADIATLFLGFVAALATFFGL
jgi:hypothetical protein